MSRPISLLAGLVQGTVAAVLLTAAVSLGGCGDAADSGAAADGADEPGSQGSSSTRAPLAVPPDPGQPPAADGLSDELRAEVLASTVHIGGIACGRAAAGSGFAVAPDLIATSAHTVVGLEWAVVSGLDGLTMQAVPVAFDARNDLALLEVGSPVFEPLPLGTADDDTIGALMGWEDEQTPDPTPFGIDRPITVRIVAVAAQEEIERESWLLAAEVESGDSGAALVDSEGVVVGIAYATTRRDHPVGYATRSEELAALLEQGRDHDVEIPGC